MPGILEHKGYSGRVDFDADAGILRGEVLNLRDVITFEGKTVAEVTRAFRDSVDDYLAFCAERGEAPERPASGRLLVRISPPVHAWLKIEAKRSGISVNELVIRNLSRDYRHRDQAATDNEQAATTSKPTARGRYQAANLPKKSSAKKRRKGDVKKAGRPKAPAGT